MDEKVKAQYETYPYPYRDPNVVAAPGASFPALTNLLSINHHCFSGRRDLSKPLRILVAGGGTGDAVIDLGRHARELGVTVEIVYLDLADTSRQIAIARAKKHELVGIDFLLGSLLDLPTLGLGKFDYINCSGVLHHLEIPEQGTRALGESLASDGGLGIMLYGELGRIGVYHAQEMLRLLTRDRPDVEKLATARRLLKSLPATNWLQKNEQSRYTDTLTDIEVYDRFLHSRDRAYTVPSCLELAKSAGLRIVDFNPSLLYNPRLVLSDPELLARAEKLPKFDRYAFAELLSGIVGKIEFFAVHSSNAVREATPEDPSAIPVFTVGSGTLAADTIVAKGALTLTIGGLTITLSMPLSPTALAAMRLIDGRRTLGAIREAVQAELGNSVPFESFVREFRAFYDLLHDASTMVVRYAV